LLFLFSALGIGASTMYCGKPDRAEGGVTPQLFLWFYRSCFFIKSVWAMPAATSAAIAAFEMVFFGETFITFGRVIEIFALD